ncbi:hypothetical protein AWZ03_014940, partial [Drosophila navojoa]
FMRFIAKRWLLPSRLDLAKPLAPSPASAPQLLPVGLQAKSSAVSATNWRRDNDNDNSNSNGNGNGNDNSQLATSNQQHLPSASTKM